MIKKVKNKKAEYPEHIKRYIESAKTLSNANDFASQLFKKATGMTAPDRLTAFIAPDVVLKIITGDEKSKVLIEKGSEKFHLFTSDFALYEAIGSVSKKELDLNSLINFLHAVSVIPSIKTRLSMGRVDNLREVLKK